MKANLWRLYNLATGYGQRPSEIAGLQTDLGRWFLDESCLVTGRRIEKLLNEGKDPWAELREQKAEGSSRFRSAKTSGRKIKKVKK